VRGAECLEGDGLRKKTEEGGKWSPEVSKEKPEKAATPHAAKVKSNATAFSRVVNDGNWESWT